MQKPKLSGLALLRIQAAQTEAAIADLEAQNVAIGHIARFWPPQEGRQARAWVIENIASGTVPRAIVRMPLPAPCRTVKALDAATAPKTPRTTAPIGLRATESRAETIG